MVCHHCGSESYRKNGSYQGVQRYFCKHCQRTFTSKGPRFFDREVKNLALEMYMNNVGIRKIARFVGSSSTAVIKWIRAARKKLAEEIRQVSEEVEEAMPDVIEMDEIFTFVKKNGKERLYGLLIVDGKAALLPIRSGKGLPPP